MLLSRRESAAAPPRRTRTIASGCRRRVLFDLWDDLYWAVRSSSWGLADAESLLRRQERSKVPASAKRRVLLALADLSSGRAAENSHLRDASRPLVHDGGGMRNAMIAHHASKRAETRHGPAGASRIETASWTPREPRARILPRSWLLDLVAAEAAGRKGRRAPRFTASSKSWPPRTGRGCEGPPRELGRNTDARPRWTRRTPRRRRRPPLQALLRLKPSNPRQAREAVLERTGAALEAILSDAGIDYGAATASVGEGH